MTWQRELPTESGVWLRSTLGKRGIKRLSVVYVLPGSVPGTVRIKYGQKPPAWWLRVPDVPKEQKHD